MQEGGRGECRREGEGGVGGRERSVGGRERGCRREGEGNAERGVREWRGVCKSEGGCERGEEREGGQKQTDPSHNILYTCSLPLSNKQHQ